MIQCNNLLLIIFVFILINKPFFYSWFTMHNIQSECQNMLKNKFLSKILQNWMLKHLGNGFLSTIINYCISSENNQSKGVFVAMVKLVCAHQ